MTTRNVARFLITMEVLGRSEIATASDRAAQFFEEHGIHLAK
jgi:hypothetical protein